MSCDHDQIFEKVKQATHTEFATEEADAIVAADSSQLVFIETHQAIVLIKFGEHITSHVCRDTINSFSLREEEHKDVKYLKYEPAS